MVPEVKRESRSIFSEKQIIRVKIPSRHGGTIPLDAAVSSFDPPFLDIQFHPDQLPTNDVAVLGEWIVISDHEAEVIASRAKLRQVLDENRVRVELTETSSHEIARGYHRVDTEIYLRYSREGALHKSSRETRQKVNISGQGLRWLAPERFTIGTRLDLELVLPGSLLETVHCTGVVVRVAPAGEKYETALKIADIEPQEGEKLLTFCMAEQFRQMRTKARILASFLSPTLSQSHNS